MSGVPHEVLEVADDETFSTPDVCRMARVSFRQVDYWLRVGTVTIDVAARGSGSSRRFTAAEVRDVAMVGRLRELGVSLEAIEEVLHVMHDAAPDALLVIASEFVRVVDPLEVAQAITDAQGAGIVVSPDSLRLLSADGDRGADRCASGRTRRPTRRP